MFVIDHDTNSAPSSVGFPNKIKFNGSGAEYFKIWIVNLMLSIVTLGIYSAWAKVRTKRYFYGNTELDGAVFEYHATPIMILKGRIIAVVLFVSLAILVNFYPILELPLYAIVTLLSPWVIWRGMIFNARMSSYRNVRFGFLGKLSKLYIYIILLPFLPLIVASIFTGITFLTTGALIGSYSKSVFSAAIISMVLLVPYVQTKLLSYHFNNHRYGRASFKSNLEASKLYIIYLKLVGLGVLATILISAIIGAVVSFKVGLVDIQELTLGQITTGMKVFSGLGFAIVFLTTAFAYKAYLQSRVRNYVFGNLELVADITFRSQIHARSLFFIFTTNVLALIVTLGFAYPWTVIRLVKYKLETLGVTSRTELGKFVTQIEIKQSAIGEELGEAFDLDLNLGI